MEYRALYKMGNNPISQSTVKTKRNQKIKRERSTKRNNLFLSGRNLKDSIIKNNDEAREKIKRIDTAARQEAYLEKFLAWRAEKEKKLKESTRQVKPKPFVTAVKCSLVEPAYKFDPPAGCKDHKAGKITNPKVKVETKKQQKHEQPKPFRKPLAPLKTNIPLGPVKPVKAADPPKGQLKTTSNNKQRPRSIKENAPKRGLQPPKLTVPASEDETPHKVNGQVEVEDRNAINDFPKFLTSTGRKSMQNLKTPPKENFDETISPIDQNISIELEPGTTDPVTKTKRRSKSARKGLIIPSEGARDEVKLSPSHQKNGLKVLQSTSITSTSPDQPPPNKLPNESFDLNTTPIPSTNITPPNYMSPFVTICRGKVSAKKEREKRESIYKLEESSPGEPIEVRRKRESAKYFRKILTDEIVRLHGRCEFWEQYRIENAKKVEEIGSDMIDATIGQTKLLTSKKLEQFRGLIDRCEHGCLKEDVGELTQAILPEDLEGFWSMVQLQIENVDKRFETLERWRANDWTDPDEEKLRTKKNLTKGNKVKKVTRKPIKPNEQLRELLKKAQATYKRNKTNNGVTDNDVILVVQKKRLSASRRSNSNTPVRKSSKCLESVPGISLNKGSLESRRNSANLTVRRNSTPRTAGDTSRRNMRVSTLTKAHERRSLGRRLSNSPLVIPRKSILKTPGTKKKQKQKVFFNDKLDFNSPENLMSGIKPLSDEDSSVLQRSMHLRSRRIILNPDLEIEIP